MLAVPLETSATPSTVPVPMSPCQNVTVPPLGVPTAGATALTVAVKRTFWLTPAGLSDEARVIELLPAVTLCVSVPLLPAKFGGLDGVYTASTVYVPPARAFVIEA